jgi:hypothetical protein
MRLPSVFRSLRPRRSPSRAVLPFATVALTGIALAGVWRAARRRHGALERTLDECVGPSETEAHLAGP